MVGEIPTRRAISRSVCSSARSARIAACRSARVGWTAPQLFGVHPEHGFLRVEYAGALMVNKRPVIGVEDARIVFDRFSGYRTKPGQIWGVPVWDFAVKGL